MVSSTRHRNRESILLQGDSFTLAPHVFSVYVHGCIVLCSVFVGPWAPW